MGKDYESGPHEEVRMTAGELAELTRHASMVGALCALQLRDAVRSGGNVDFCGVLRSAIDIAEEFRTAEEFFTAEELN